jgi:hypothetical protein
VKPPSSLVELARLVLHVGMPAPSYTFEEVEAAKAELDRQLKALGDFAHEMAVATMELQGYLDFMEAARHPDPQLIARVAAQRRTLEQIAQLRSVLVVHQGFLNDYLILLSPNFHGTKQREDAAERIADRLEKPGPFAPNARGALRQAARIQNKPWEELLRQTIIRAIYMVADGAEQPQTVKRKKWVTGKDGKKVEVRPARQFGPASPEFYAWFENKVRDLVERSFSQDGRQRGEDWEVGHESVRGSDGKVTRRKVFRRKPLNEAARGVPGLAGDPEEQVQRRELEVLLDRVLTAKQRDLLDRSEQGGLGARDRKELQRLPDKLKKYF